MEFLKSPHTYAVTCKLPTDAKDWVHEPGYIVEVNYMTPMGERRILMEDISINVFVLGLLIIRGRCMFGQVAKGVDLRLYRKPVTPGQSEQLIDFWGLQFFDLSRR